MTATQRPEPGALVRATGQSNAAFITAAGAAAVEERKALNLAAAQIAGLNWGKALDDNTRRAVAEWARRHNVDVTREIDVLGGRIYINAAHSQRRLGELQDAGVITGYRQTSITDDPRLAQIETEMAKSASPADTELAAEARRIRTARLMERIRWGVPDKALAAYVTTITVRGVSAPIEECNFVDGKNDPVGTADPDLAARTRSMHRAMRLLRDRVAAADDGATEGLDVIEAVVTEGRARAKADIARTEVRVSTPMALPAGDEYGTATPISQVDLDVLNEQLEQEAEEARAAHAAAEAGDGAVGRGR